VLYDDAQQAGKAPFLVELAHIIQKTKVPIMITGDFNMIGRASNKNKSGGFNKWSILFNFVISQGELMEITLSGRRYTWSNNQEDPTFELLDRVLVSPTWEEKIPLLLLPHWPVTFLITCLYSSTLVSSLLSSPEHHQFLDLKIASLKGRA
jgi:hypothetical protein